MLAAFHHEVKGSIAARMEFSARVKFEVVVISNVAVKEASDNRGASVVALGEQRQVLLEEIMAARQQEKMQETIIPGSTQSLNTTVMSLSSLEEEPCSRAFVLASLVPVSQATKLCLV
jgi:hypothetical protein